MAGSRRKNSRNQAANVLSRAGTSQSHLPGAEQGTEEDLSDHSLLDGYTAIGGQGGDYSQPAEHRKEESNDPQSDIERQNLGDSRDSAYEDADQVEFDQRKQDSTEQTNPTPTYTREAQRHPSKKDQDFVPEYSHTGRQSNHPRQELPQQGRQETRDQKPTSSRHHHPQKEGDLDRVQQNMARGLGSLSSGQRDQPSGAASRSKSQNNGAVERHVNHGECPTHRPDHTHECMARNRTKDYNHSKPSKHSSELASSRRRETHKEVKKSQGELLDPTAVRIRGRAKDYVLAILEKGNLEGYFGSFADELVMEIKQLQDQVNALSEEMLAGRDRYQPITDGEFKALMDTLCEYVKVLSKDLMKAARAAETRDKSFDFRAILEKEILTSNVDDDAWTDNKRIYLVQSAIWRVLKDHLFSSPFQVFGNEGPELWGTWKLLFSEVKDQGQNDDPGPPRQTELSEKWKSLSATRLEEKHRDDPAAGLEYAGQVLLDKLAGPLSANTLVYSAESGWGKALNDLLHCAGQLATSMAKQRSRFDLYVPDVAALRREQSLNKNVHTWGKIADVEDGYEVSGRIAFVVIPGLRRWGDGLGTNLNRFMDLEAAQVRCIDHDG